METKLQTLKRHIANGDYRAAIQLAGSWPSLGKHKEAITRAKSAYNNPGLYEGMGRNVEVLIRAGIAALHERYEIPLPASERWPEWARQNRYLVLRVNDGTPEGCCRATYEQYSGFGKDAKQAIADLEAVIKQAAKKAGK